MSSKSAQPLVETNRSNYSLSRTLDASSVSHMASPSRARLAVDPLDAQSVAKREIYCAEQELSGHTPLVFQVWPGRGASRRLVESSRRSAWEAA